MPNNLAADLMNEAAAVRMTPVDPDDIHVAVKAEIEFHEEQKYEQFAEEQPPLWKAEGEALARPYEAEAARLEPEASAQEVRLRQSTVRYEASSELLQAAAGVDRCARCTPAPDSPAGRLAQGRLICARDYGSARGGRG